MNLKDLSTINEMMEDEEPNELKLGEPTFTTKFFDEYQDKWNEMNKHFDTLDGDVMVNGQQVLDVAYDHSWNANPSTGSMDEPDEDNIEDLTVECIGHLMHAGEDDEHYGIFCNHRVRDTDVTCDGKSLYDCIVKSHEGDNDV